MDQVSMIYTDQVAGLAPYADQVQALSPAQISDQVAASSPTMTGVTTAYSTTSSPAGLNLTSVLNNLVNQAGAVQITTAAQPAAVATALAQGIPNPAQSVAVLNQGLGGMLPLLLLAAGAFIIIETTKH